MKRQKGITLVALIITIIILLIISGITIKSLIGSKLFEKTTESKERYNNAQIKEEIKLYDYETKVGEYIEGNRQSSNITRGETILWNCENDKNGALINAGLTDGTSEKVFLEYNVNDFDAVIVIAGSSDYVPDYILHPLYISKSDFNKRIFGMCFVGSTYNWNTYIVKIDAENNKICFLEKGRITNKYI